MTEQELKINKGAAEALGFNEFKEDWFTDFSPEFTKLRVCSMGGICSVINMRFHDSYDWAWLLVKKVEEMNLMFHLNNHEFDYNSQNVFEATPLKITTACLEVLNG